MMPALIFAAGFGTRMGALTQNRPKPLIQVAGTALVDHALAQVRSAHCDPIVVNAHYLKDQIIAHFADQPDITISTEHPEIRDTGGGLKQALPLLGRDPVITINSDMVWRGPNPIAMIQSHWDPDKMDALLLLIPRQKALGHSGTGDFFLDDAGGKPTGQIQRRGTKTTAPFVYSGLQILKTEGLNKIEEHCFSLNRLWDEMLAQGRAFGAVYSGGWVDVGRPENIATAQAELAK